MGAGVGLEGEDVGFDGEDVGVEEGEAVGTVVEEEGAVEGLDEGDLVGGVVVGLDVGVVGLDVHFGRDRLEVF